MGGEGGEEGAQLGVGHLEGVVAVEDFEGGALEGGGGGEGAEEGREG